MQVVMCELVGKFSFALPDNDPVRVRLVLNTLQPTMSNGKNGVPLRVTRLHAGAPHASLALGAVEVNLRTNPQK